MTPRTLAQHAATLNGETRPGSELLLAVFRRLVFLRECSARAPTCTPHLARRTTPRWTQPYLTSLARWLPDHAMWFAQVLLHAFSRFPLRNASSRPQHAIWCALRSSRIVPSHSLLLPTPPPPRLRGTLGLLNCARRELTRASLIGGEAVARGPADLSVSCGVPGEGEWRGSLFRACGRSAQMRVAHMFGRCHVPWVPPPQHKYRVALLLPHVHLVPGGFTSLRDRSPIA